RVLGEAENGLELRLAAALESDAASLAEFDDLFDDVALLVDLDRIDGRVRAGVAELLARLLEARREILDARTEDVGESQQHRQRDPLLLEVVRDLEKVHRVVRTIFVRTHDDVSRVVDVEEAGAPALDTIESAGRVDGPATGPRIARRCGASRA